MPLFEYECRKCGKRFSLLVGVTAEKTRLACPKCGSRQARKLISRIARTPRGEDDFDDDLGDLDEEMPDLGDDDGDGEFDDSED